MVYIGVDLGGTNIKIALVDDTYTIVNQQSRPTNLPRTAELVTDDIILGIQDLLMQNNIKMQQIGGIGIGCPGMVDDATGTIRYSNNLDWHNFPLATYIQNKLGILPMVGNDANVAALGEAAAGSAKGASSAVIVTLGTGVGSGVVLNGKILTGCNGAASEIGHMVVQKDGRPCTCGRKGCLESYASATALIHSASEAIRQNPDSILAKLAAEKGEVDGKMPFDAKEQGDPVAAKVVEEYIEYLALGIANIVNIFQPEVVSLSGGISKQKEKLLVPLREKVYKQVFGGTGSGIARIEVCTLGYKAGLIGAAVLAQNK